MALLFTILSGIFGAVVNATALGAGNLAFSMLRDHGAEKERKRYDLSKEELQKARNEWNEDRMKWLHFIKKRLREKMRQGHTSTMLMTPYLNTIKYLQKN